MDYCYKDLKEIKASLIARPQDYTAWFQLAFPKVAKWWQHLKANIDL
jgi:isopentenyl-diphosphate delta-isomerase